VGNAQQDSFSNVKLRDWLLSSYRVKQSRRERNRKGKRTIGKNQFGDGWGHGKGGGVGCRVGGTKKTLTVD